MADAPLPNDAAGHRARLRARLLESEGTALADYELLEYLLMLGLPRIDTKPLAKALLAEFGDLRRVLTARPDELARVKGSATAVLARSSLPAPRQPPCSPLRLATRPCSRVGRRCSTTCAPICLG